MQYCFSVVLSGLFQIKEKQVFFFNTDLSHWAACFDIKHGSFNFVPQNHNSSEASVKTFCSESNYALWCLHNVFFFLLILAHNTLGIFCHKMEGGEKELKKIWIWNFNRILLIFHYSSPETWEGSVYTHSNNNYKLHHNIGNPWLTTNNFVTIQSYDSLGTGLYGP